MKMSVILGVCALTGAVLLVYLFYVLFRGEKQ